MAIIINPISPVAVSVFGFDVRWYALAYIAAFVIGFIMFRRMAGNLEFSKKQFDDLFTAVILGVILGGRLGYVLFYNLSYFVANPLEIFAIWQGGMSFHGGLLGVIAAVFIATKKPLRVLDIMAVIAPIGLFFGRIANFINMEVMGRPTDGPLGVVFAEYDPTPRHPSPLYEAATEGVLLFIVMYCLWRFTRLRERAGALGGIFLALYAVFRIFCEQFRAPDAQIGFLTSWGLTMGQLLSAAMFIVGVVVFNPLRGRRGARRAG